MTNGAYRNRTNRTRTNRTDLRCFFGDSDIFISLESGASA